MWFATHRYDDGGQGFSDIIVSRLGLDDWKTEVLFLSAGIDFCLFHSAHTGYGIHPTSYPYNYATFPGVKRPEREAEHSPSSSTEL
jgi:hypothetical protein